MRRITIGVFLVLHGLAHASAGVWASTMAFPWLSTALWAGATMSFLAAGVALIGVPALRGYWRGLAINGAVCSLLLLIIYPHSALVPGIVINVAIVVAARRVPLPLPAAQPARSPLRRVARRAGHGLGWALIAYAGVLVVGRPWYTTWGTTRAERAAPVPGDHLGPLAHYRIDHAVTIDAPRDAVWPWLLQLGQDRGGFYSYERLERMIGDDVHNVDRIVPEWQQRTVGDLVRAVQPDYLGGIVGRDVGWRITALEANHYMVLENWGAFILEPLDDGTTRLFVRTRGDGTPSLSAVVLAPAGLLLFEPAHFIMQRRMLLGIKAVAERSAVVTSDHSP